MRCFIYKSSRKEGAYAFLRVRDDFAVLPPELAASLGRLTFTMEIELVPGRRLAREEASVVMEHLARQGFHLQLPPPVVPPAFPVD